MLQWSEPDRYQDMSVDELRGYEKRVSAVLLGRDINVYPGEKYTLIQIRDELARRTKEQPG